MHLADAISGACDYVRHAARVPDVRGQGFKPTKVFKPFNCRAFDGLIGWVQMPQKDKPSRSRTSTSYYTP